MAVGKGDKVDKVDKPFNVLSETAKLNDFLRQITMNSRHKGNLNPLVLGDLKATTKGTFTKVELGDLGDDGAEAGLRVAGPEAEAPIRLVYANSGTTAQFTMTRLVKAHPALKAPKHRVRVFPVSVRTVGNQPMLVLDLKGSYLEAVEIPEPKKDENENQNDSKNNDKATAAAKGKNNGLEKKGAKGSGSAANTGDAKAVKPPAPGADRTGIDPATEVAATTDDAGPKKE